MVSFYFVISIYNYIKIGFLKLMSSKRLEWLSTMQIMLNKNFPFFSTYHGSLAPFTYLNYVTGTIELVGQSKKESVADIS